MDNNSYQEQLNAFWKDVPEAEVLKAIQQPEVTEMLNAAVYELIKAYAGILAQMAAKNSKNDEDFFTDPIEWCRKHRTLRGMRPDSVKTKRDRQKWSLYARWYANEVKNFLIPWLESYEFVPDGQELYYAKQIELLRDRIDSARSTLAVFYAWRPGAGRKERKPEQIKLLQEVYDEYRDSPELTAANTKGERTNRIVDEAARRWEQKGMGHIAPDNFRKLMSRIKK